MPVLRGKGCRAGRYLYDHAGLAGGGRLARNGAIVPDLVRIIEDANAGRGVSTGREQFDWPIIARLVHGARRLHVGHHDIMASIADATAKLIFGAIKRCLKELGASGALQRTKLDDGGVSYSVDMKS